MQNDVSHAQTTSPGSLTTLLFGGVPRATVLLLLGLASWCFAVAGLWAIGRTAVLLARHLPI